jgi:Fe-S cluster biogenesis protein NfuA/nitrite reductase/ring-hydroxylating ferredoxin subunit
MDEVEVRDRVAHVEQLLESIESLADAGARRKAITTVQALLELYEEALGRVLGRLSEVDARALAEDELLGHLLIVHGLHPVELETRVQRALDEVRPYLGSHGGDVELLGVNEGVVRVRLDGSCDGCPSSAVTLKLAIEEAIFKAAPEIERVVAEGEEEPVGPTLLQIETRIRGAATPAARWLDVGPLSQLPAGSPVIKDVGGEALLFLRLDGTPYAYARLCPACGGELENARLDGEELGCRRCGARFDVRRAGLSLDRSGLQLRPIPLLVEAGMMRVGLEGAA